MKFIKTTTGIYIIAIMIAYDGISSELSLDARSKVYSALGTAITGAATAPGPVGSGIFIAVGLINIAQIVIDDTKTKLNDQLSIAKEDVEKIMKQLKDNDEHLFSESNRIINSLAQHIDFRTFISPMRISLETIENFFYDNVRILINPNNTGTIKDLRENDMLSTNSKVRQEMTMFVSTYIKSRSSFSSSSENLYYEVILNQVLTSSGKYCNYSSTYYDIIKSYTHIGRVLNDGYALAAATHAILYKKNLRANQISAADTVKFVFNQLVTEYISNMRDLSWKTNSTLDKLYREFKNCSNLVSKHVIYRIPTYTLSAKNGYVITGFRFKIKENEDLQKRMLNFEIQQAKFIDSHTVDINTIHWTGAPSNLNYTYVDLKALFSVHDLLLPVNFYLTGLRLGVYYCPFDCRAGSEQFIHFVATGKKLNTQNKAETSEPDTRVYYNVSSNNMIKFSASSFRSGKYLVRYHDEKIPETVSEIIMADPRITRCRESCVDIMRYIYIDLGDKITFPPAPMKGIGILNGNILKVKLFTAPYNYSSTLVDFSSYEKYLRNDYPIL